MENRPRIGKQRQYDISKLGEQYWAQRIPRENVFITQETKACLEARNRIPTRLIGDRELLTANLKNLSRYLAAGGVKVRAWSFFSGELPDAEMMYQAEQEPEDILELASTPSFAELRRERKIQIQTEKLFYRTHGAFSAYDKGAQIYLIDDIAAFEQEMMARRDFDERTVPALLKLGINVIYCGESKLFSEGSRLVRIARFEGKLRAYQGRY